MAGEWGLGGAGYLPHPYLADATGGLTLASNPLADESASISQARQMGCRGKEVGWRGLLGTFLEEDLGTGTATRQPPP